MIILQNNRDEMRETITKLEAGKWIYLSFFLY
jgi:hypothetical protein